MHLPKQIRHHQGILSLSKPLIMGILNLTPDSFTDGGQFTTTAQAIAHAEKLTKEGAHIIDVGAMSSRPTSEPISIEEEWSRLKSVLTLLIQESYIVSVDTFRPEIAKRAIDIGVHVINDIYGGQQPGMFEVCATHQTPLVLMHMQGTPKTMQQNPQYENITMEVFQFFNQQIRLAHEKRCFELIVDPGFGFGKTVAHNYELFKNLAVFQTLELPILIGISRKSMLCKAFQGSWENLTSVQEALHLQACLQGVSILRTHDAALAKKTIELYQLIG